ncbi:hypothetical protein BDF14DRAFT_1722976 [Spinellus fusiger]|nr:hypothetical protein BDF14DRAFT_1722976 [Spinellus fusiger]
MAWGCTCKSKVPDCPPYQWPVTVAECNGREHACRMGCGEGPTNTLCTTGCQCYYKCNQPGSVQSFLRTDTENQKPIYNVPVVNSVPRQGSLSLPLSLFSFLLILYGHMSGTI